jgi:hypothetical protein
MYLLYLFSCWLSFSILRKVIWCVLYGLYLNRMLVISLGVGKVGCDSVFLPLFLWWLETPLWFTPKYFSSNFSHLKATFKWLGPTCVHINLSFTWYFLCNWPILFYLKFIYFLKELQMKTNNTCHK